VITDLDECIHVLVPEMPAIDESSDALRRRTKDLSTLDRVDAVRSPGRGARLGTVVADGDVDPVVVDRPEIGVRPRVQEGTTDRVRLVDRCDRPSPVVVVVRLGDVELAGYL
jgi:hypothetical protein